MILSVLLTNVLLNLLIVSALTFTNNFFLSSFVSAGAFFCVINGYIFFAIKDIKKLFINVPTVCTTR